MATPSDTQSPKSPTTPIETQSPTSPTTPIKTQSPKSPTTPIKTQSPKSPTTPIKTQSPMSPTTPGKIPSETPSPMTPASSSTKLNKSDCLSSSTSIPQCRCQRQFRQCPPAMVKYSQKILLLQPSSAASERVFSLLKSTFGDQHDNSLQDYIECSLMLQYNNCGL